MDQNFACILNGLLVGFGANMAQKASQKGAQESYERRPRTPRESTIEGRTALAAKKRR